MRVFISYSSRDRETVRRFEAALHGRRPDLSCFFDERGLTGGVYWIPRLGEELGKAEVVLLLLGTSIGPWQELEYYEALRLSRQAGHGGRPRIIPVAIVDQPAPGLAFLSTLHQVFALDLTSAPALLAIENALSAVPTPEALAPWRRFQPYTGLPALTERDAAFFFGREKETADVLDLLARARGRIVTLIGQSGVGKSSLIMAGVLSRLKSQLWPIEGAAWPAGLQESRSYLQLTMSPGRDPVKELAVALVRLFRTKDESEEIEREASGWTARFREGSRLRDMLRLTRDRIAEQQGGYPPKRFVLYVDQGEELYTRAPKDEARLFSRLLADAAEELEAFTVLLSLRSDFYTDFQNDGAIFDLSEKFDLLPLASDALIDVILKPAEVLGASFEDANLPRLIAEATQREPGALPLLSDLLQEMWLNMLSRSDGVLRWSDQPGIVDIGLPLKRRADAFLELPATDPDAVRRLFTLRLAQVAQVGEPVRRRARKNECTPAEWLVAEQLAGSNQRLLTISNPLLGEPIVEVAHEQLLQSWPTLKGWLEEEREILIWRTDTERASAEYGKLPVEKRPEAVLMGLRLTTAESWFAQRADDLAPELRDYVKASIGRRDELLERQKREEAQKLEAMAAVQAERETALHEAEEALKQAADAQRKRARFRNIALAVVSGLAVLAVVLGWNAEQQRKFAETQRMAAERQTRQADDILGRATNIIAKLQTKMDDETKAEAFALFQTGAEHGDQTSMGNLGSSYDRGIGATQDYAKAREWYEKAANEGNANAMRNLGLLYDTGHGVAQNYAKAREWYERAAANGEATAMTDLGVLYEQARGVAQDYAKAREWYEKAAANDEATAMRDLGVLYEKARGVAQDYAKAREWYEKAADKENASAMLNLGLLYDSGHGVAQDYAKAREWYEKAVDKGNASAMRNLGLLYDSGHGVAQDYAKAREWYERAAANGEATAMTDLGLLYDSGHGVAQDYAKGREWYEKAAANDEATAMRNLGVLYEKARGVARDYAKAREWYEKAAAKENASAMRNLGVLYENARGVTQDYAKAREWYEKAANEGNAGAMRNLGLLYDSGHGVAQDYAKAREWYERAAANGEATAMTDLGVLYEKAHGVAQDYAKAREWYKRAAANGEATAMTDLGLLYDSGHGVAQDYAKAREWYEKAADKGNASAMLNLGLLYDNGHGVAQDYAKAREWYEKAANEGNASAMRNLGLLYDSGQGVTQDYAKAREWYEKAANEGNASAMRNLGLLYDSGHGVAQDYAKGREWYEKAAANGEATAMTDLGVLYENARGVARDYAKAREWYERAAANGEATAMRDLGVLYEKARGVAQDYAKAREWYENAAAHDDANAKEALDRLPIREAEAAGLYAEALQRQEALAAKIEAEETKRDGTPGDRTQSELSNVTWYALLAKQFTKALTVADRCHALVPDTIWTEINRAHALMFMERGQEATALYLSHKGKSLPELDDELWERAVAEDFAQFHRAGLTHPLMARIEKELGVSF